MILSSRPTDRRQLIEEAAGITKYKARRRSAELKLEAAQQNLTRLDDIVFEVEKQRGALKRQAAKARRYTRLRDEMRRWEKVLFARRYRALADAIETARGRLADAREQRDRRRGPAGRSRNRRSRASASSWPRPMPWPTAAREDAHARELDINRRAAADRARSRSRPRCSRRAPTSSMQERQQLEARREPERLALEGRRQAVIEAEQPARRRHRRGAGRAPRTTPAPSRPSKRSSRTWSGPARTSMPCSTRSPPSTPPSQSAGAQRERAVQSEQRFEHGVARAGGRARQGPRRAADVGRAAAPRAGRPRCRPRRAGRARVGAGQRARSSTNGAPATCASREHELAGTDGPPALARGARRAPRRLRRRRAHGAGQRQRPGRPDGRARRLPRGRAAATSAPSRRAWAICSSTSWSSASSTCPPACG